MNTSNKRTIKKETFLAALFNSDGNISKACGMTNISTDPNSIGDKSDGGGCSPP
jgi:hypothetical protein